MGRHGRSMPKFSARRYRVSSCPQSKPCRAEESTIPVVGEARVTRHYKRRQTGWIQPRNTLQPRGHGDSVDLQNSEDPQVEAASPDTSNLDGAGWKNSLGAMHSF